VVLAEREITLTYAPRGASLDAFSRRDAELVLSGPAGTGKTRSLLEKVHLCAARYPGMRAVFLRKTLVDLVGSALVTYQKKVLHPLDGVQFYGGSTREPPAFRYPNGSEILLGGLDKPTKVMSKEFDVAYVNEATELTEADWDSITTRLRNWVMPYQQIIADCNPDSPTHWLKRRAEAGKTTMIESRHEDNPELVGVDGLYTDRGTEYLSKLDNLSGVRYLRLRKGVWAAAEGMVFDGWDRAQHVVEPFLIPREWARYWVVDFGYVNPFCWQAWAEDPDGRLYRYHEIYMTHQIVEDHARHILSVTAGEPKPQAIICDHDAEDRATLERHLGMSTTAADKAVSPGLQAVNARLRSGPSGRPRLAYVRGALVERDPILVEAGKPTCSEDEIEGYVWNLDAGRRRGEEPVKKDDHGMDATRYMVMQLDADSARAQELGGDVVDMLAKFTGL
jgi:PBSX family phage terminase large subunit